MGATKQYVLRDEKGETSLVSDINASTLFYSKRAAIDFLNSYTAKRKANNVVSIIELETLNKPPYIHQSW